MNAGGGRMNAKGRREKLGEDNRNTKKIQNHRIRFFESIQNCIAFQSNIIFNTGI